jgi:membrane protease YdiL (CAAX protease family)
MPRRCEIDTCRPSCDIDSRRPVQGSPLSTSSGVPAATSAADDQTRDVSVSLPTVGACIGLKVIQRNAAGRNLGVRTDEHTSPLLSNIAWVKRFDRWSGSRAPALWAGRIRTATVLVFLWFALLLATLTACHTIGNSLPGVTHLVSPPQLALTATLTVGVALAGVIANANFQARLPWRRRLRRIAERARLLSIYLLRDVLDLIIPSPTRTALTISAGVAAGITSILIVSALLLVPGLAQTAPATDARFDAVRGAPLWVPPAFFAVVAPAPEELIYRGPLLAATVLVLARTKSTWIRATAIGGALVVTSILFGYAHLSWSLLNALSAGATGVLFGAAALATRSLWAAIIAHALYNALIFVI